MKWSAASFLLVSGLAVAGRPDYSPHLSDDQLLQHITAIAIGLAGFAGLGIYSWWRYRRTYVPAPGRFTPMQVLASVLAVIALVLLAAAVKLR